jgi:hypothetical protein
VREQLDALLLVGIGPGHDPPGPFGVDGVGGDVRNVGRDADEIPRTGLGPRLQLLTEPQHRPSLQEVDRGFVSGVAVGLGSSAGRDRKKVGTQRSRSRRLGRDALELAQPLPLGAGRSCRKHDHRSHEAPFSSPAKPDRPRRPSSASSRWCLAYHCRAPSVGLAARSGSPRPGLTPLVAWCRADSAARARWAALGLRSIRAARTTTGTGGHPSRRPAMPLAGRSTSRSSPTTTRSSPRAAARPAGACRRDRLLPRTSLACTPGDSAAATSRTTTVTCALPLSWQSRALAGLTTYSGGQGPVKVPWWPMRVV